VRVSETLFTSLLLSLGSIQAESTRPSIPLILADNLGYGDLACYKPDSKVPIPLFLTGSFPFDHSAIFASIGPPSTMLTTPGQ
jgi:hypothetical protein